MQSKDICDVTKVNEKIVGEVKQQLPDLTKVVTLFKALADETRLKIAYALTIEEELCVCDVSEIIGSSVATASHHLRFLRDLSLAKSRRKGKLVYYSLADHHVNELVKIAYEHSVEEELGSNEQLR
ncbi:winged helix-turn-helix transcriptional regulator [Psychrobacillus sp. Sa2BUA9]|uniref:Winged helix-turn-helix transcriptional regulator n=1 Tax=Psychrobacillus faecigallinarum TaxID=2762235 RepID=A0ABR8RE93_9BACI|nr:metalloregulator ArsR/SmtB family transcription factor [Psychrobacillus faecigallinarum]MBD7946111.1 winged helix-turn-helix transcriptional regulator [Psychrobacillus faecigallinarum]QGM32340.1 metalloregulator ArsR/SmtB family transcription factor [Bacillus sp. N3536]